MTYLYQFWLFSFKTAKYWGHGPVKWTADLLDFDRFRDKEATNSLSSTPRSNVGTPGGVTTPRSEGSERNPTRVDSRPSPLCQWSIRAAIRERIERDDELDAEPEEYVLAPDSEEIWPRWPDAEIEVAFEEKLQAALENGSFSNVSPGKLPMAVAQIAKITRRSPKELLQECFAFSLVARNEEIFWKLLPRVAETNFADTGIYPLHLSTSFLDGSKTCCNLLGAALNSMAETLSIEKLYVDNHGHTVLDNLMISILKAHTSCRPISVNDKFAKLKRFAGEEVDICGRWDADSDCVRDLFAEGCSTIPIEWKHMFCHTSVQTICHCIERLFGPKFAPNINAPSGLFTKYCQACGMRLQLLPLHSLVLTTVHLAKSGCPGENLFGMLACLVCLLANGANPAANAFISLDALTNPDKDAHCDHENLDPVQLAERISTFVMAGCAEEVKLGWQVFYSVLKYARDGRRSQSKPTSNRKDRDQDFDILFEFSGDETYNNGDSDADSMDTQSDIDEDFCDDLKENPYGQSKAIGTLWAAIQTELVTYRRLTETDPWISRYFDMRSLLNGINNGGIISIPLVEEDMIVPYCLCGRFVRWWCVLS